MTTNPGTTGSSVSVANHVRGVKKLCVEVDGRRCHEDWEQDRAREQALEQHESAIARQLGSSRTFVRRFIG